MAVLPERVSRYAPAVTALCLTLMAPGLLSRVSPVLAISFIFKPAACKQGSRVFNFAQCRAWLPVADNHAQTPSLTWAPWEWRTESIHCGVGAWVEWNGEEVPEGVRLLVRDVPKEEKRMVLLGSGKEQSER